MADFVRTLDRCGPLDRLESDARARVAAPMARFSLRLPETGIAAASASLGLDLAQPINRAEAARSCTAFRLGPDEWLLLANEDEADTIATALAAALPDGRFALVDIAQRQTAIMLEGEAACAMLNAGCPLDLDLAAFPVGTATHTLFFKADIVLWRTDPAAFHIEVWRSFAPYVWELLTIVGREYPVSP
ncbi:MAG: sarcosine oxidase subunit gamma [Acidiphilium sp.]